MSRPALGPAQEWGFSPHDRRIAAPPRTAQVCAEPRRPRDRIFASQPPGTYAFETRSIRLNGQSTSVRLEKVFWGILKEIAANEGMTVPRFISTLHREVLTMWGEVPNFTSHLRCICVVAIETRRVERRRGGAKAA